MAQAVSFSSDKLGESTEVLTLDGVCNLSTARAVERGILAALEDGRTAIIFDLRGVSSLGSATLHMLFRGLIRAKGRSASLSLVRPNTYVWDFVENSGLDQAFQTFLDLEHAFLNVAHHDATPDGGSATPEHLG